MQSRSAALSIVIAHLLSDVSAWDGDYKVGFGHFDVSGYVCEGKSTAVYYPKDYPKGSGPFPIVAYAHGSEGGISQEREEALKRVAGFGMIVVAPKTSGNDDSCSSSTEWKDIVTVLEAAKANMVRRNQTHSALSSADWSSVGIWGDSMGAKTIGYGMDANAYAAFNLKAVLFAHGARKSSNVTVPAMFVTSTDDTSSSPASVVKEEFDECSSSYKVFANFQDLGHNEEASGLWQATFLACQVMGEKRSCHRLETHLCSQGKVPVQDCIIETGRSEVVSV